MDSSFKLPARLFSRLLSGKPEAIQKTTPALRDLEIQSGPFGNSESDQINRIGKLKPVPAQPKFRTGATKGISALAPMRRLVVCER